MIRRQLEAASRPSPKGSLRFALKALGLDTTSSPAKEAARRETAGVVKPE
jgi:hypothetical protein